MSNYTKTTNFLRKDSLPDSSTEKIIRGSEFDTEFNNLMTSVNSKANLNSPDFIGTPLAPTAAVGTNTRQIATTAFVSQNAMISGMIVMWSGPVGSIPIGYTLCDGTYGTPNLVNRFIMGAGPGRTPRDTGGNADAVVVSHTHSGTTNSAGTHTHSGSTSSAGAHRHTQSPPAASIYGGGGWKGGGSEGATTYTGDAGAHTHGMALNNAGAHQHSFGTSNASGGRSGTNANLPPYYALCFIMKN